jgi:hypothetical protein
MSGIPQTQSRQTFAVDSQSAAPSWLAEATSGEPWRQAGNDGRWSYNGKPNLAGRSQLNVILDEWMMISSLTPSFSRDGSAARYRLTGRPDRQEAVRMKTMKWTASRPYDLARAQPTEGSLRNSQT